MSRTHILAGSCLLVLTVAGCSFVDSSESISDSISKSSESSSDSSASSSPSEKEAAYRDDIRDYTAAYVRAGGQIDLFWRDVGSIASKHGVSNWESDGATYTGIGEGLAKANVTSTEFRVYKQHLTGYDEKKMQEIQNGYDSVKKE
jgi:hypothetical protein